MRKPWFLGSTIFCLLLLALLGQSYALSARAMNDTLAPTPMPAEATPATLPSSTDAPPPAPSELPVQPALDTKRLFPTLVELRDSQEPAAIAAPQDVLPYRYFLFSIGAQASVGELNASNGVAVAPDGTVYVADTSNHRIQRFSAMGTFLGQWGAQGSGDGQFYNPRGVAVAPDGTVYVADTDNSRIQYFSASGTFLGQWGAYGYGDGQFRGPYSVAVAANGTIYVTDTSNHRIQYFNATGAYLGKWGSQGSGDGQFAYPVAVAVASGGTVYVADAENHRIQYFGTTGTYLGKWGFQGSGDGQFNLPYSVAVALDDTVYVVDSNNHRIQYFSASGTYLGQWGGYDGSFSYPTGVAVAPNSTVYVADTTYHDRIQYFDASGTYLGQWGSYNYDASQFNDHHGVAVASDGTIYVADTFNDRIQYFSATGAYLGQLDSQFNLPHGVAVASDRTVYVADTSSSCIQYFSAAGTYLGRWGNFGFGDGQFAFPLGIAVASNGTVYVADTYNDRIQYFSATGTYLGQWGTQGTGDGQFTSPYAVSVASNDTVYVADRSNHRIQYFSASGTYLGKWGSQGSGEGQFSFPSGVAVAPGNTIYVVDTNNNRIQHFSPTGTYLGQWGTYGPSDNQFSRPSSVAVASDGTIYVADTENQRVQAFGMAYPTTWRGEYFANHWLVDAPALIRDDPWISFLEWDGDSPDPIIPTDYFSVRWQRYIYIADPGYYHFQLHLDDGGRLWIDDALMIEEWRHPQVAWFNRTVFLDSGYHRIRLDYYEYNGWAGVYLDWWMEPPAVPILNTIADGDGTYVVNWTPFHDITFDLDSGGFSGQGTWTWGTVGPYSGTRPYSPTNAYSGVKAWATNLTGDYNNNEDIYLTSPLIDLSPYQGGLELRWWQWLYTEGGCDYATVEVCGGGSGWTGIYGPVSGDVDLQWTQYTHDLSAFVGVSDFQVRFHFTSDGSAVYPGWYIDDISIPGVSGATGYTLQEDTGNDFTNPTTVYSGSSISTILSGKAPGTYYYRVKAFNDGGDSAWSNVQSVVVIEPPTAPTLNAIANADGDGDYVVDWSTVSGATNYTLQEATNSSFTDATTAYNGSGTSTSITGKAPGTYYYRVKASNGGGDSPWSNVQSVVVIEPPTAPTLNAIANADGDGDYTVSWSTVSSATDYTLQEATNSSFTDATTVYNGSGTSTSITGKAPGTYYYRVKSSNVRGDSPWSNVQSVVVVALPTAPTLNAIANADGDGNYTVSWSTVSVATGYTLQEATNSSFTDAVTVYNGSGTSTSITGKAPGTYYYRVSSSNVRGDSPWSNVQSVVEVELPTAPTLNAIANTDGDGNYTVSWSAVSVATGYTLQEATNSSFTGATTAYNGSGTSTSIAGKAPGTYYYRVSSSNVRGNSPWSNVQSVIVVTPATAPVLNVIANTDGDGNYTVSWSTVIDATNYTLQEAANSSFTDATTVYNGGGTSTSIIGKAPGTYYYRARSSNVLGDSSWSNVRQVAVLYHVYLPLTLRDYVQYFEGPWEIEPNDTYLQANGPLVSDRDYYGYPNDAKDYYSVYLRHPGTLTVSLKIDSQVQPAQLQLFYQGVHHDPVAIVTRPPYTFTYNGSAGWYYVYIYIGGGYNSTTPYTLRVTYPE